MKNQDEINLLLNQEDQLEYNPQDQQQLYKIIKKNKKVEYELPMRHYEVKSQYLKRKKVYENALQQLKSQQKAVTYSNIWYNITYMKNKYPQEIEIKVMKYAQF